MSNSNKKYTIWNKPIRWICVAPLLLCILLYIKIYSISNGTNKDNFVKGYFVNTSGCSVMSLNPFAKEALRYLHKFEPMKCGKFQLLEGMTIKDENYLVLMKSKREIVKFCNVKKVSDVFCFYWNVHRIRDTVNNYTKGVLFRLNLKRRKYQLQSGELIIRVRCFGGNKKPVYHDVHFFLPIPSNHSHPKSGNKQLSAMIMGIDSISHMHYIRTMPLLRAYIETLPYVEFWGYNRIGSNTYPNLVPMLSGLNVDELEKDCYIGEQSYDKCNFIWKHFKKAGYNTTYGEDNSVVGLLNYDKKGFNRSPTDFYLYPAMLDITLHTRYSLDTGEFVHCSGNRKLSEILHEFIYKMIPHFRTGPYFSFFWEGQGVHDYFNYAQFLDGDYVKLMKRLKTNHILSNTLIILVSDHGTRRGAYRLTEQGMLEESQPMLIAIYPKWLEEAYPLAMSNLRKNSHSLITPFDLHATLMDLTNLNLLRDDNIEKRTASLQQFGSDMPRGISLFLPIPDIRDCHMASIPDQFCLCHKLPEIPRTDYRSEQASLFMVKSINDLIQNYSQCHHLELKTIHTAYLLHQSYEHEAFGVKVIFTTDPGEGIFEGTTRFIGNKLALSGSVLRINQYGNQSYCVNNYKIEMYCYCGN